MSMSRSRTVRFAAFALAAATGLLSAACADDATGPVEVTEALVAGLYQATDDFGALSFTTTAEGETTDWLAAGGSLSLSLGADGTVSGELYLPGADEGGADLDADMAGSWSLEGNSVTFEQDADTFVRDMPFVFADGVLTGEATFQGVRVRVVLIQR
jgi:hypothetical protein